MNEEVSGLHDLIRRTRRCRVAKCSDIASMAALARSGSMFEHVLRHRYSSPEAFLSGVFEQSDTPIAYVSNDEHAALVGWACCFAFHKRVGYAQVVQLALGWRGDIGNGNATEAYRLCEAVCREGKVRSIFGFATRKMPDMTLWYAEQGFELLGTLDLAGGDELQVFCKVVTG